MSFIDIEAQNPYFDKESDLINDLTINVRSLERELKKFGTKKDSDNLRKQIENEIIPKCSSLINIIIRNNTIKNNENSKLYNDFKLLSNHFMFLQTLYKDNKLKYTISNPKLLMIDKNIKLPPDKSDSSYVSIMVNETSPLINKSKESVLPEQTQTQIYASLNQTELDFQTSLQQEREEQINRIHGSVNEINAIFNQLGNLVKEQGNEMNSINDNINQFSNNAERANDQLKKANENQRQRGKCEFITLTVIVIVTLIMILAILG